MRSRIQEAMVFGKTTYREGPPLLRKKRFALNKMFQQNASEIAIFYVQIKKPTKFFFGFSFRATLLFPWSMSIDREK